MHRLFSDWQTVHLQQIMEADQVFSYGVIQMTHIGALAGVPATGKRVVLEVFSIDQVDNGIVI